MTNGYWRYDPWPVGQNQSGLLEGLSTGQDRCRLGWTKSGKITRGSSYIYQ